jgi:hypothetical protein
VPHYPLAADPGATIHQSFTVGRVVFLVTDCRERERIADHVVRLGLVGKLVMLSGDPHMLAMDDGTHRQFLVMLSGDPHMLAMDDGTHRQFLRDLVPSRGLLMLGGAISESPTPPLRIH